MRLEPDDFFARVGLKNLDDAGVVASHSKQCAVAGKTLCNCTSYP